MPFKKNFEVGLQTPPSPQTPYTAYGKGKKLKIWILCLPSSKCIQSNLKGIVITPESLQETARVMWSGIGLSVDIPAVLLDPPNVNQQ